LIWVGVMAPCGVPIAEIRCTWTFTAWFAGVASEPELISKMDGCVAAVAMMFSDALVVDCVLVQFAATK